MARVPSVELLNSTHIFPGEYTFKVIGQKSETFTEQVRLAATGKNWPAPRVSERPSADGNFISVTVDVRVPSAESVVEIYHHLLQLPGLRMLL